jgi:hypothetical protein
MARFAGAIVLVLWPCLAAAARSDAVPSLKAAPAETNLAAAERGILAGFSKTYPARPDGPNRRPMARVIVTLKPNTPVDRFLAAINGRYFTQQWCLMPAVDGAVRLGLDTTRDGSQQALVKALKALDVVRDAEPGEKSKYLKEVLGPIQWREVSNFGPFELLAQHVTRGSRPDEVTRLLGKPHETLSGGRLWRYTYLIGPHASAVVSVRWDSGRVAGCTLRAEFHGPPVR